MDNDILVAVNENLSGAEEGGYLYGAIVTGRNNGKSSIVTDYDLNFAAQIQVERIRQIVSELCPSGVLKRNIPEVTPELSTFEGLLGYTGIHDQIQFANFKALVNGVEVIVENAVTAEYVDNSGNAVSGARNVDPNYCHVRLPLGPAAGTRTDLIWLECWKRQITNDDTGVAVGEIALQGNVENDEVYNENLDDNIQGPLTTITNMDRVQWQYRLRVSDNVSLTGNPEGLGDDVHVLPQGAKDLAVSGYAFFNMGKPMGGGSIAARCNKDDGLWRAGEGDVTLDSDGNSTCPFGTVDGYVYAIPLFIIHRQNTSAWNAGNNLNGTQYAAPSSDSWSYGHPWASERPDGAYKDIPTWKGITDLRHEVTYGNFDPKGVMLETWDKLLRGELFTHCGQANVNADVHGRALLQQDVVASGTVGALWPGTGVTNAVCIANPCAHPQNSGVGWTTTYTDDGYTNCWTLYTYSGQSGAVGAGQTGFAYDASSGVSVVKYSIPSCMHSGDTFDSVCHRAWFSSGTNIYNDVVNGIWTLSANAQTGTFTFTGTQLGTGSRMWLSVVPVMAASGHGLTEQPRTIHEAWNIESGFGGPVAIAKARYESERHSGMFEVEDLYRRHTYLTGHGPCTADQGASGYGSGCTTDRLLRTTLDCVCTETGFVDRAECWYAKLYVRGNAGVDIGTGYSHRPLYSATNNKWSFRTTLYGQNDREIKWIQQMNRVEAGSPQGTGGGVLFISGITLDKSNGLISLYFNDHPASGQTLEFVCEVGERQIGVRPYAKGINQMAKCSEVWCTTSGNGVLRDFYFETSGYIFGASDKIVSEGTASGYMCWQGDDPAATLLTGVDVSLVARPFHNVLLVRLAAPLAAGKQLMVNVKETWAVDPNGGQFGIWYDYVPYQGQSTEIKATLLESDECMWNSILGPQMSLRYAEDIAGAAYRLPIGSGQQEYWLEETSPSAVNYKGLATGTPSSPTPIGMMRHTQNWAYVGGGSDFRFFAPASRLNVEICGGVSGGRGRTGWIRRGSSDEPIVVTAESDLYASACHLNYTLGLVRVWNWSSFETGSSELTLGATLGTFTAGERISGTTSNTFGYITDVQTVGTVTILSVNFITPQSGFSIGETIVGLTNGGTGTLGSATYVSQCPVVTPCLALVVGSAWRTDKDPGFIGSEDSSYADTDVVDWFIVPGRKLIHQDVESIPWKFPA